MERRGNKPAYRILLVHPHPVVRAGISGWLQECHQPSVMLVASLAGFSEALNWLKHEQADLILFEPWQGAVGGIEEIERFRACSDAHLLLFTAENSSELQDRAVMAGVRGILAVDSDCPTVLIAIQRVLEGELWLSREATGRIFDAMAKGGSATHDDPHRQRLSQLTQREREILIVCMESGGATARRVAECLHISEHTLRNHLTSIYSKLGVSNRLELYAYAQKHIPDHRLV